MEKSSRNDRFSKATRRALTLATKQAKLLGHGDVAPEHVLLGLLSLKTGITPLVLAGLGFKLKTVKSQVIFWRGKGRGSIGAEPGLTSAAKRLIELAQDEARRTASPLMEAEHLLIGLLRQGDGLGCAILEASDADLDKVRGEIARVRFLKGKKRRAAMRRHA